MHLFFKFDSAGRGIRAPGRVRAGLAILTALAVGWAGTMRAAAGAGNDGESVAVPAFKFVAPLASLVTTAEAAGIALSGFEPAGAPGGLREGDSATVLVTLTEGENVQQWLTHLRASTPDETEKNRLRNRALRLYSPFGTELDYTGNAVAVQIRVFGAFRGRGTTDRTRIRDVKEETDRVVVNADFLGLGFARACVSLLRIRAVGAAQGEAVPFEFEARRSAFPPEEVAARQELRQRLGITPEEERAMAGIAPTRTEFFRIARNSPGMDDAIRHVIDVPWWSVIFSGGRVRVTFRDLPAMDSVNAEPWRVPAMVFALPTLLYVNGKPAMTFQLAAVDPRPPLQLTAGVVGVAAQRPDGRGPHFMIQVLAARRGTGEALGVRDGPEDPAASGNPSR